MGIATRLACGSNEPRVQSYCLFQERKRELMWNIGELHLPNRVVSAPMAGITNRVYRRLTQSMGAGLIYTEMVSDKALCFDNANTLRMLELDASEERVALQIFGGEPETMARAARIVTERTKAPIIDINMGCPVPKVLRAGAGSKLMQDPDLAEAIARAVVQATPRIVTVKMRLGWDQGHINVIEMAQRMERAGVQALTIHARTRSQMYEGHSDWSYLKAVKQSVTIPVIGNGDIKTPEDAKRMLEETGVDAVMIARGALGNPWLFQRTVHYLETGILLPEPSFAQRLATCIAHGEALAKDYDNELAAMREMRAQAGWYVRGMPHASAFRSALQQIETLDQLRFHVEALRQTIEETDGISYNDTLDNKK